MTNGFIKWPMKLPVTFQAVVLYNLFPTLPNRCTGAFFIVIYHPFVKGGRWFYRVTCEASTNLPCRCLVSSFLHDKWILTVLRLTANDFTYWVKSCSKSICLLAMTYRPCSVRHLRHELEPTKFSCGPTSQSIITYYFSNVCFPFENEDDKCACPRGHCSYSNQ